MITGRMSGVWKICTGYRKCRKPKDTKRGRREIEIPKRVIVGGNELA